MRRLQGKRRELRFFPGGKTSDQLARAGGAEHAYVPRRSSSGTQAQAEMGPRRVWNYFVMTIGYLAIAYNVIRGIIYLLVLAEDWM